MKYKLINNKTKEETICSLVTIDVFEYYVENTVPFFNDWLYDNLDNRIWHLTNLGCLQAYHSQKCNNWSKIRSLKSFYGLWLFLQLSSLCL